MISKTFVLRTDANASQLWAFLKANWRAMASEGKPLSVHVDEHKAQRTTAQNRIYWKRLNQIAEEGWIDGKQFSAEAYHELFKRNYIGMEKMPDGGMVGISTRTLKVGEFTEYLNKVAAFAASELGIELEA